MNRTLVAVLGFAAALVLVGCSSESSTGTSTEPSAAPSESGAAEGVLEADNRAALDSLPPAELLPTSAQASALGASWTEVAAASALPAWIPPVAGDVGESTCLQAGAQAAATEYTEAASTSYSDDSDSGSSQASWMLYRFGTDDVAQLYVERLEVANAACAAESAADPSIEPLSVYLSEVDGAIGSESQLEDGTGDRTIAVQHLNLVAVATSQTSTETADRMAALQLSLLQDAQ